MLATEDISDSYRDHVREFERFYEMTSTPKRRRNSKIQTGVDVISETKKPFARRAFFMSQRHHFNIVHRSKTLLQHREGIRTISPGRLANYVQAKDLKMTHGSLPSLGRLRKL